MALLGPELVIDSDTLLKAASNREAALRDLDRLDSEESLMGFVRAAWKQDGVEPSAPFTDGWAIQAVAEHLEAVTRGEIKRLLINIPPGCTKSLLTNVLWPAWEWGPQKLPHHRFISGSYEKGLATRDLLRGRDLITGDWYQSLWPHVQLKSDQDQKTHYVNTKTGWRYASSVGGALTGYRGDRIVIDDPHDVQAAESDVERDSGLRWFTETVPTRLNKMTESAIVVIMQRLHERDISGLILSELLDDWTTLILPMEYEPGEEKTSTKVISYATGEPFKDPRTEEGELLWPERFPREAVDELKRNMSSESGSYAVACQLQQRPIPRGGGMFKADGFLMWPETMSLPEGRVRVRGWDLAATDSKRAAATAGVLMSMLSDGRIIIEDVAWLQGTDLAVEQTIKRCADADGHSTVQDLPQDPGQAGKTQKANLARLLTGFDVRFSPESGSKEDRARPLAAQVEAGNVYMMPAPWNYKFVKEASSFPRGALKDQVDAASRAYANLLTRYRTERRMSAPPQTIE